MSLEQIKYKLSECFNNHQPILLYNDSADKRNDLILTIHTKNGGKVDNVQYISTKEADTLLKNMERQHFYEEEKKAKEELGIRLISIVPYDLKSIGYDKVKKEILNKSEENFKSTKEYWEYLDCRSRNGESVYRLLVNGRLWIKNSEYIPTAKTSGFGEVYGKQALIWGSFLSDYKGTLFVDNLECDKGHDDVLNYCKLADEIKNDKVSVNWLVVYVHNRDNFPEPFLNLFKQVSLDLGNEEAGVEPVTETAKPNEHQDGKVVLTHEPPQEDIKDEYIFRKDGERWYIKFENEVLKPEDSDGFNYIHYIMKYYYQKSITPRELYQAIKGIKASVKDDNISMETYSVQSKEIDEANLEELNKLNDDSSGKHKHKVGMQQFDEEFEALNKVETKKILDQWKREKENLENKKAELLEEGRNSEAEDIGNDIINKQKLLDAATRQGHDSEHKQYYDLVSKAIKKAKDKIRELSIKEGFGESLLIWNHFEDSIHIRNSLYSYNPQNHLNWIF